MNAIPQPADLSKLKGILGKAKAVMNKVNEGNYESGNVDGTALVQNTDGYLDAQSTGNVDYGIPQQIGNPVRQPGQITEVAINNSRMPEIIKQAMRNNPIQQAVMNHTFNLDDVSDLIEKPMPAPQARRTTQPSRVNESVIAQQNDKLMVSESVLRDMIKDILIEYLVGDYQKQITEGTIKKTINTLIKEGKIRTK
jgi:hypothetical protein